MANRVVHFASSGFRTQLIEVAPLADDKPSKRYPLIETEDKNLVRNMGELDESTKAKNRAFEERLNEIRKLSSEWEAKLRTETKESEESISTLKKEYQKHLNNLKKTLLFKIDKTFDKIEQNDYPVQVKRVDKLEDEMDVFFHKQVPDCIESHSGEVSRQLKKQYETFDIEKQKESKREKKIVSHANEHIQSTAQHFTDEEALMQARFFSLEDDIIDTERRAARSLARHFEEAFTSVVKVKELVAAEGSTRKTNDLDVLDTLLKTQHELQHTVIEHFGSDAQSKQLLLQLFRDKNNNDNVIKSHK